MADILVVCIVSPEWWVLDPSESEPLPQKGIVYTVDEVGPPCQPYPICCGRGTYIRLVEIPDNLYCSTGFRPVKPTSIESLRATIKTKEAVDG